MTSFQDKSRLLLDKHEIEYDEKYIGIALRQVVSASGLSFVFHIYVPMADAMG